MLDEYSYELKIPKERVAVLIGANGDTKKQLEKETDSKIAVDSKEGDVTVTGSDAIKLFSLREMIKAIGRGFNPDIAMSLLKPDYVFELINMSDFAKTKNSEVRLKGRVIGKAGKSREKIEFLTETSICVFGKTVGIIGEAGAVANARRAIVSLLNGSTHTSVFRFLEKKRAEEKRMEYGTAEVD